MPPTSGAQRLPTETKEKIYVCLVSYCDYTTHNILESTYRSDRLAQILSFNRLQTQRKTNRPDESSTHALQDASNSKNRQSRPNKQQDRSGEKGHQSGQERHLAR